MEFIQTVISLGPSIMMPIIFFLLALLFGVTLGKAFKAGMLVGIGFTGIGLVIGMLLESLGPATIAMVKKFGLNLTAVDAGWPVGATIGWATPIVPFVVFGGLGINLIMLCFNLTKTVNIDIFNYWHFLLTGGVVYAISHNVMIGTAAALVHFLIILIIADKTAVKIQQEYDLKGISFAHATSAAFVPVGIAVNWVIEQIPGLRSIEANPDMIMKKFGVMGEPLTLGTILGLGLGFLAGWDTKDTVMLAVKIAAVMVLLPSMINVLVEGLVTVRDAAEASLKKRFPHREFYIGLDTALLIGDPAVLATGLLMIPAALILALLLPGNKVLPFVDLSALAFLIPMVAPYCRRNMLRIFLAGVVILIIVLYAGTYCASYYTEAAHIANVSMPKGVNSTEIVNMVGGHATPIGWILIILTKIFG
ncbi:PTS system galactitol-specific EIIC component [Sporomusa rhizae]|uniref:PTS transporter subunit IIC n=1 Tax=Sporomusa rhizae TaxID=357999 RepID=UPI00352B2094